MIGRLQSPDNVKMSGHLYKKGVNHKNWAKRYFTLHGPFLFYFHDAQDSKPIGMCANGKLSAAISLMEHLLDFMSRGTAVARLSD